MRPRLVNPDLTGERVDLAGGGAAEEEEKEEGGEGAGSAADAEVESLAGSVEAYCDAAGADAVAPVEEPRVKIEPRSDDEKARRRAESVERAALMAKLSPEVKMRVARRELTLPQALADQGGSE